MIAHRRRDPDERKVQKQKKVRVSRRGTFFLAGNHPLQNEGQSEVFDFSDEHRPRVLVADFPPQPVDLLNQPKTTNLNEP